MLEIAELRKGLAELRKRREEYEAKAEKAKYSPMNVRVVDIYLELKREMGK